MRNAVLMMLPKATSLTVGTAGPKGFTPVTTYATAQSSTWAQPAISGNRIFVKDVSTLALWTIQ